MVLSATCHPIAKYETAVTLAPWAGTPTAHAGKMVEKGFLHIYIVRRLESHRVLHLDRTIYAASCNRHRQFNEITNSLRMNDLSRLCHLLASLLSTAFLATGCSGELWRFRGRIQIWERGMSLHDDAALFCSASSS
jgi:hypothetical protein